MKTVSAYILPVVLIISLLLGLSVSAVFENLSGQYRAVNASAQQEDETVQQISCVELARLYLKNIMKTQPLSAYLSNNSRLPSNFAPPGYSCPNVRLVRLTHTSAASNTSTSSLSAQYGAGNSRTQRYVQVRVEDDMKRVGLNKNIAVTMGYAE